MSSVTDVFVIIGDTDRESAESIAPKVARAIKDFRGADWRLPVISLMRDDWQALQGGSKVAGSAAIWFGYNYADMGGLEAHLLAEGFTNLTVWSHHENDSDKAPRVVSW
ncbi:hypothetical protein [Streptomyces formicae]|uniref:Uncharacterized protein n=1 Tax=Streptomyces formicae TaxID=1616117 RepID=A0ABY3WI95_9ACTN|nr:hypothetical protein [Streptomyces formicae]UNM12303.1 hypothetical protein J4032_12860 [Streptomyces formicae]